MFNLEPEVTVAIYGIIGAFISSLIASLLVYKANSKRIPSQNSKDDMDAAKIAMEIAENASSRQLTLEKEVQELRRKVYAPRHFKITIIFTAGEIPKMEKAEVEEIADLRTYLQPSIK